MSGVIAVIAAWSAAMLLYRSAPRQLLGAPLQHRRSVFAIAVLLLIGAFALLLRQAGPATAVFELILILMVFWTLAPPVIAWIAVRKREQR